MKINKNPKLFVGTDVGSSWTKVALLDENRKLVGYALKKSGTDFSATAEHCLQSSTSPLSG